ncbi:MAG: OmpA family protein [Gammaproteobacteria bacterium]|nr:OmpA family protein [Gammaproteobacteria bacterium]
MNQFSQQVQALIIGATVLVTSACADLKLANMDNIEQLQELSDLDHDGVIGARDKCIETMLGAQINNLGCSNSQATNQRLTLDIKFANHSAIIPSDDYQQIEQVAKFLTDDPDNKVLIEAHTSKVGLAAENKRLSQQRAQALATVLINDFDIEPLQISTIGYGFERLKAYGDTDKDHRINRRIVAQLSKTAQVDQMIWTIYSVDQIEY